MRLGIFGGSFDPVHHGHLTLARCAIEQARLDQLWLVPAAVQPHKPSGSLASNEDRAEMLRLAVRSMPQVRVSTIEIDRGGVSYTIDTLRAVRERFPAAELFLLMGADTLLDLPKWREPEQILALATPLVATRAGESQLDFAPLAKYLLPARVAEIRRQAINMPSLAISSSEIRRRVACSEEVDQLTPHAVKLYISEHNLYRQA